MNKRKFILILIIVFVFSLFISYKDLKNIYDLKLLQEKENDLKIENDNLLEEIDKKTKEVEYLKEQNNFIETSKLKKAEKEIEIEKLKEEIQAKEQENNKIKNKITNKQASIEEIKKYIVN